MLLFVEAEGASVHERQELDGVDGEICRLVPALLADKQTDSCDGRPETVGWNARVTVPRAEIRC